MMKSFLRLLAVTMALASYSAEAKLRGNTDTAAAAGNRKLDGMFSRTPQPTPLPTSPPTASPTDAPSTSPSAAPTGKPSETPTASPSSKPTAAPTDQPSVATPSPTAAPTGPVTMSPTMCKESYLSSENLNIALIVDLSFSTYETEFSSEEPIGDFNGDGKNNTILDAQIVAIKDLLEKISETGTLNNENCEIELISFHTDATSHGVWPPLSDDGSTYNEEMIEYIKLNLRTPTSIDDILETNNGFTNFDAALDEAVEYFQNSATPDRKNLMVFLSDGEPNVRGDGDDEQYCAFETKSWLDDEIHICATLNITAGEVSDFCGANTDCSAQHDLQDCVRGPNLCQNSEATTQYESELAALDELEVERLAIGIGQDSNVGNGTALWMIDNNPGKDMGILPLQALNLEDLSIYLSSLCILTTEPPTSSPSSSPSESPTKYPTTSPSSSPTATPTKNPTPEPTGAPSASPTAEPTASPTEAPTLYPTTSSPTYILPDCYEGPLMVLKDSSSVDMCVYHDDMVEITEMKQDIVNFKINDVWTNNDSVTPSSLTIYVHENGVDSVIQQNDGDGFQCENNQGSYILPRFDIGSDDEFAARCFQAEEDGEKKWLAVVDVVITDDIICGSNEVAHPCFPDQDVILESCSWRIIIPCETAATCTDEPTSSPTKAPTTDEPTSSPTKAPTNPPTNPLEPLSDDDDDVEDDRFYPPVGPEECPEDLLLLKQIGVKELPHDAVKIIDQGTEFVTVQVNQAYSETEISHFYYQYSENLFNNKCYEEQEFQADASVEITIQCTVNSQIAVLELWVADPILSDGNNAEIPNCCHPTVPEGTPVTKYMIEIKCVTACPDDIA